MKLNNNENVVRTSNRKRIQSALLLCILVLVLGGFFFPRTLLIDFLFYEEKPVKADVIILLSGEKEERGRMTKVAELYHAGYADRVLLTNATSPGSSIEYAESFGIPRDALLTENKATSTYENALYAKEIVLERGFDSALVVTSNYHMRRAKLAFERVFHDSGVSFTYVPYHPKSITRDSWKENHELFKKEYKKLIGAYFLYFDGVITPLRKALED
ncbi:YdcF family protein [Bacillus benzoevorans]|uniref:Uncharacterized SAM-binding protein YcdF (DUF218 family) n=1 Tax=Bacillus benzoevorans TaxID=1456 RepID=A0A7X0HTU8_9BACI|nr:YdcF family protein [Bacillus benzoevorans]MBB6446764.1 uncharacterized SAM-binding protein YcdF (DUF218 family) [Bacillus benzoevorans]